MHLAVFARPGPTATVLLYPLQHVGHTCEPFSSMADFLAQGQQQIASFDAFLVSVWWEEASPQQGLALWHLLEQCPQQPCVLLSHGPTEVEEAIMARFPQVKVLAAPISSMQLQQAFAAFPQQMISDPPASESQ